MIKGVSKRVVVLQLEREHERVFEQAIFIVRPDAFEGQGVSQHEILQEAKRVAEDYVRKNLQSKRKKIRLSGPAFAAAGAALSSAAWLVLRFIGV